MNRPLCTVGVSFYVCGLFTIVKSFFFKKKVLNHKFFYQVCSVMIVGATLCFCGIHTTTLTKNKNNGVFKTRFPKTHTQETLSSCKQWASLLCNVFKAKE